MAAVSDDEGGGRQDLFVWNVAVYFDVRARREGCRVDGRSGRDHGMGGQSTDSSRIFRSARCCPSKLRLLRLTRISGSRSDTGVNVDGIGCRTTPV